MKIKILLLLLSCSIFSTACQSQKSEDPIRKIDLQLKKGETTVAKVLADESLMPLHSLTPFREIIKAHAREGKFSMVTANEPGTKVTIKGQVVDAEGTLMEHLTVYVYQTSDRGWYADTAAHILLNSGDTNHARLFAYFKTDANGRFEYETIKPAGYPQSDLAAHIHIHFWAKDGSPLYGATGELQFDDDPRMTPSRRQRSLQEGALIAKNSGTAQQPVYEYRILIDR